MAKRTPADILADMEVVSRAEDLDVARYEELEGELAAANKAEEIVKRQAAYKAPRVTAAPVVTGTVAADDEMSRAFNDYLRTGKPNGDLISRAQSEGTGSAGGFLVPEMFQNRIIERMKAFGGLQNAASGISTSTGAPLSWLTNDDVLSTEAGIVAENASNSFGADLVFGKNSLGAYKYDTAGASGDLLKVSWELLQDSEFDITGFIAKKFGERLARKIAVDLINGSGVNEPQGIISTQGALTNSGVTLASATAGPSYAELVTIEHSLDPAYRANASWLMNDKTLSLLEQLVDTTGRPLVWGMANSLGEGRQPKTLLGYPVVIDQAMPDMLTGSTKGIVFGDLSETYIVRTVKDMAILQDPYSYIRTGQTGFLAWMRLDAMVQNVNSAVYATSHS
jgi:HK97 family phage major capsid protein